MADLGFFDLTAFAEVGAQDGYWLSRLHFGTAVYDADGRPWEVLALLAAQGPAQGDLPITLGAQQRLPARLLAVPPTGSWYGPIYPNDIEVLEEVSGRADQAILFKQKGEARANHDLPAPSLR